MNDKHNEIIIGQWRDSKVVNFVSSEKNLKIGKVRRRQCNKLDKHTCPEVPVHCQQTMCGVDKGDRMRLHGGGFARKAHFKKWHKKAFLAVVDCMLLNSLVGWNLSSKEHRSNRRELKRHEFFTWVAEAMLTHKDPTLNARSPEQVRDATASLCVGTFAHRPKQAPNRSRCAVCKLDSNCDKNASGVMDATHCCAAPTCGRTAHEGFLAAPRKIHNLQAFQGMTCFEILHSDVGKAVWKHKGAERATAKEKLCSVNYGHPVVQDLRTMHGRQAKSQKPSRGDKRTHNKTPQHARPTQKKVNHKTHKELNITSLFIIAFVSLIFHCHHFVVAVYSSLNPARFSSFSLKCLSTKP